MARGSESNAVARKKLDRISAEVSALGVNTNNGSPPTYKALRAFLSPYADKMSRDDTTGFDEPLVRKNPHTWDLKRNSAYSCSPTLRIVHDGGPNRQVINLQIDGSSGSSGDVMWFDDPYYPDWLAYGEQSWAGQRAIDVRHLTDDEFEMLKTLVDCYGSMQMWSTWVQWHYRATLDQCKTVLDRYASQTRSGGRLGYNAPYWLRIPFGYHWPNPGNVVNFKGTIADAARHYMPANLVANSTRILDIFDRLKLKVREL